MPHAILLSGVEGIGKRDFAQSVVEALLCRNRQGCHACGECESCRQLLADSHPDYQKLMPEGASSVIKVDSVRALVDWLQLTASQGSHRIALIEQADRLNRNAANSLLKTLEEPGEQAILILSATRAGALPATIRSRCQKVTLKMTNQAAAIAWLEGQVDDPVAALAGAGGGPYLAVDNASPESLAAEEKLLAAWRDLFLHKGSVGRISDSLSDLDTSVCLATFCRWCLMAIKRREGLQGVATAAVAEVISETQTRMTNDQWYRFYDRLLQLHRTDSASFKTQMVLEGLFADTRLMTISAATR